MALHVLPKDRAAGAAEQRRAFVRHLRNGPPPAIQVLLGREAASRPLLTVIIPTADGRRDGNLARLLAQLERQTFQQFEVVIVRGDRRQGRAINTGAAIARGDLLVTLDDDTRIGPDNLFEQMVAVFTREEMVGIVGVPNLVPQDAPWVVRRAMRELPRRSSAPVGRMTDSDMAEHPCLAIRKALFYRVGGEHEWIPRGLDPYLRCEVRRLGYRVVVIPGVWIHHLLPPTLRGILRQYFRNGLGAAYVRKFYSEFAIDQATDHRDLPPKSSPARRAWRYAGRLFLSLVTIRWIYLGTLVSYALGYAWGLWSLREDSL